MALALLSALAAGCGPGDRARPPSVQARRVRVIAPREAPRLPFRVDVGAQMVDREVCEVRLRLRSSQGGAATVEFTLPDGAELVEGPLARGLDLAPGSENEERLVVRVPEGGHRMLAVVATVNGRRAEAFVEFGERPSAEDRGLGVRTGSGGDRVLRLGPEELRTR